MDNQPNTENRREGEEFFSEIVCSPEFPQGCAEPAEADAADARECEDVPVFTDDACSAEFPDGCVNPLEEEP